MFENNVFDVMSKPPDWVGWLAVPISAGTIFVTVWKFGQRLVFWIDWFLIKPLVVRLRNEKVAFRILIARIAGDERPKRNRTLAQRVRKVSNNLIAVPYPFQLDLKLGGRDFSSELERADRIGRRWLAMYKADLLMWGYAHADIDAADTDMHPIVLRFISANAPTKEREFSLKELVADEFWSATAEALHLEALAALDPAGELRGAPKDEPKSTPAERRRELLLQAADKSARLLDDAPGLTAQQRAELAAALAEAWFTVVDETGDVRLPPRAMPSLERALQDVGGVASATVARLHLLLARAMIGDRADRALDSIRPRAAESAIEIIDAAVRLSEKRSNRRSEAEWRFWRARCLVCLQRFHEAIEECNTALKSVTSADDPRLWGDLILLSCQCLCRRDRSSLAVLDRVVGNVAEAIASLETTASNFFGRTSRALQQLV